ncbi:alkaline phosphatase D family protein [Palleronia rufa]|uniref:alkaline phosphatase D family protein n=1 Tax=Palleronia rufa TaxID=1530186 RepID=UPI00056525C1|nr:alkaline phosphatase D family protein [Palleronia rufa]
MTDALTPTGPMLFLRSASPQGVRVAATCLRPQGAPAPVIRTDRDHEARALVTRAGATLWRADLDLPAGGARYSCDGTAYDVATDLGGDLTVAFVSCNGQEHGDLDRPPQDRNLMWSHLARRLDAETVQLLIHGGDQIYADEVTRVHPLSRDWPNDVPDRLDADQARDLRAALDDAFFRRYATQWPQPGYENVVARVPSVCMWDDHDICDGWGSLRRRAQASDVARVLFDAAREAFLLFQFGCHPDERPGISLGSGRALSWRVDLPGLSVVAPDLRSTRTKRNVMDGDTWSGFLKGLERTEERVLLVSSVPALGPRLSLVERLMKLTRRMEDYEDDLRDQWQSYAHRTEWQRFLRALMAVHDRDGHAVTVLSGEIHLATRGTMDTATGPLHQLVASGISHPAPPKAMAIGLSLLSRLGESPIKGHRIRLRPLPGQPRPYAAERNYLMLRRRDGDWTAAWQLEESGETAPLAI